MGNEIPRVTERRAKAWQPRVRSLGFIAFAPLIVMAELAVFHLIFGPNVPGWIVAVMVPSVLVWIAWVVWPMMRLHRALKKHGRFLCLHCQYSLEGLPDAGVCPECAEPYRREELERRWRLWELATNKGKEVGNREQGLGTRD
jgi:hypothetical protein